MIKKFWIYIFSLILVISSCSSEQVVPDGIIPDSSMTQLIVEFTLIDASYNTSLTDPATVKFRPELFYENALKQKGYTREEFNRSVKWYTSNTKRLLKIYDEALIILSKKQAELER